MDSLESLKAVLPVTESVVYLEHTPSADLGIEHELLRNPSSLSRWFQYIQHITDSVNSSLLDARGSASSEQVSILGGKLSSPQGRTGLARLVDVYERALAHFPSSYKLWKAYLEARKVYVLGEPSKGNKVRLNAPKRKRVELEGGC